MIQFLNLSLKYSCWSAYYAINKISRNKNLCGYCGKIGLKVTIGKKVQPKILLNLNRLIVNILQISILNLLLIVY